MSSPQERAERLMQHLLPHIQTNLTRGTDQGKASEVCLVTFGRDVTGAHEALIAIDRLNGDGIVAHAEDHTGIPDQIRVRYLNNSEEWQSHTWWDPNLTTQQLEIYTQLRADGMDRSQARVCALELGAAA